MSRRISDTQDHDVEPFDCVEGGEKYRAWRNRSKRFLACKTDKSGSSLADAWDDNDMGGAGALAPPFPGGGGGGAAALNLDIFTKALAKDAFVKFRSNLMNTDASVVLHDDEGRVISIKGKAAQ